MKQKKIMEEISFKVNSLFNIFFSSNFMRRGLKTLWESMGTCSLFAHDGCLGVTRPLQLFERKSLGGKII
jgi:hypothetical protein